MTRETLRRALVRLRPLAPALGLLLAAALLRLWATGLARFTGDESHYWQASRQLALLEKIPTYGPEITGSKAHLPGPLYYYLMAVPQALGPSPRLGAVAVVLGHLAGLWLLFRLALFARGRRMALVGLALAAFAPWEVFYADRIWGSCVVPILGALAIYGAAEARRSGPWLATSIWVCLVLPQLHMSAPVLWVSCALVLALRPPERVPWRWLGLGVALAALCYLPPAIAELRDDFPNLRGILAHAGGTLSGVERVGAALKVPLYAVLYGSSEASYHFGRGYWGGFDDAAAYLRLEGWQSWLDTHGPWVIGHAISVGLSALGWVVGLGLMLRRAAGAVRHRSRWAIGLDDVVSVGIVGGLLAATGLLFMSRKGFFPHYANVLMPFALWPILCGIDAALERASLRVPVLVALSISAFSMLSTSVRYYAEVDGLNGLGPSLAMVRDVLREREPVDLRFVHFRNHVAWRRLAETMYGRRLELLTDAPVRYVVHNREVQRGPLGEGWRRYGPVRVERVSDRGAESPDLVWRAREHWREAKVEAVAEDGRRRVCALASPLDPQCFYGDEAWQRYGPAQLRVGGHVHPLLFLHPITGSAVRAAFTRPVRARRGVLRFALSDRSTESKNTTPVEVWVRQGDSTIARGFADNSPGLRSLGFTFNATIAGDLGVEVRCAADGARVFGFDVELYE